MTRAQMHKLVNHPVTGPLADAVIQAGIAGDGATTEAEIDACKRRVDAAMDALLAARAEQLGPADGFRRAEFEAAQQES